jgi:proline-specific peptidase
MYTDQDCGQNVPITQGHAPFTVEGETFQTWFKIFGSLEGRSHRPLVVLHGGAGLTHHYVLPHQDIAQHDIPVVFYDQLGNGESTHLSEKDQEFWTIDLFIDELLSLVSHLGIQDDFDLLGHSWGGMLSSALVIRRHPPGLKHLILANCLAAKDLWTASECELMLKFSQEVLDGLEKPTTDPEFLKALYTVQGKHGCTVQPFPEDFKRSLEACYGPNGDTTVINAM